MHGCCPGNESVSAYSVAIAGRSAGPFAAIHRYPARQKGKFERLPFCCAYDLLLVNVPNLNAAALAYGQLVSAFEQTTAAAARPDLEWRHPGADLDSGHSRLSRAKSAVPVACCMIACATRWRISKSHRIPLYQASQSISSMAAAWTYLRCLCP